MKQPLKVIEAFAGIGAQAKAFELIKRENPSFNFEIVATIEWEIGAIYAYDIIHHGPQDLSCYDNYSKEDILKKLSKLNLSSDGKQPITKSALKRMSETQLKSIYFAIQRSNNKIDITNVHARQLPEADLLTYSFPCQDLSISSYWHKNFSGIDRKANNRSGLLWEIERILKEYQEENLPKPRFLLMENVTAIKSPRNVDNFETWKTELEKLGYRSYSNLDLNAKNFGIPQNRVRTYMLSVLVNDQDQWVQINEDLEHSDLHQIIEDPIIDPFLRLDYEQRPEYLQEAIDSTPNLTPSREMIYNNSIKLAFGTVTQGIIAKTITTKQDRNPNAGIIVHNLNLPNKARYRNLTPRETFLLMGFEERDFDLLISQNFSPTKSTKMLSQSKLLKLSGNSIVVNVLKSIFLEINAINETYFTNIIKFNKNSKKII